MFKNIAFIAVLICFQIVTFANSFEGKITFRKITENDTSYFSYYVKNNFVRVDEHTKNHELINSLLVNLEDSTMLALSPLRKMYMKMPVRIFDGYSNSNFKIGKTKEKKELAGYACTKWEIENKSFYSKVVYYVAQDNFDFFIPFLSVTNRSEKSAGFFTQIPGNEGYFPFRSVEYNLETNTIRLILEVTHLEKKTLDYSIFEIPKDYMLFEH